MTLDSLEPLTLINKSGRRPDMSELYQQHIMNGFYNTTKTALNEHNETN